MRAVYDKYGKAMADKEGASTGMDDAAGFFATVFGGERFKDWVRILALSSNNTTRRRVFNFHWADRRDLADEGDDFCRDHHDVRGG